MSNNRHVASSDPVANAFPDGKNWKRRGLNQLWMVKSKVNQKTYCNCVDVRLMSWESLLAHAVSDVPQLKSDYLEKGAI